MTQRSANEMRCEYIRSEAANDDDLHLLWNRKRLAVVLFDQRVVRIGMLAFEGLCLPVELQPRAEGGPFLGAVAVEDVRGQP